MIEFNEEQLLNIYAILLIFELNLKFMEIVFNKEQLLNIYDVSFTREV